MKTGIIPPFSCIGDYSRSHLLLASSYGGVKPFSPPICGESQLPLGCRTYQLSLITLLAILPNISILLFVRERENDYETKRGLI